MRVVPKEDITDPRKRGKRSQRAGARLRRRRSVIRFLRFLLRPSAIAVHVDYRIRIRIAVHVQHHARLVAVLAQMDLQTVTIFGSVRAVSAAVLVNVTVRLHVRL